jgi:hypothetical protein
MPVGLSVQTTALINTGQVVVPEGTEETITIRLLEAPVDSDTVVTVSSSDPSVAGVVGGVVILDGEQVAEITITTGEAGVADLILRVGDESRSFTIIVGTPPEGSVPPVVAGPVGLALMPSLSVGQVIMLEGSEQTITVRLLINPAPLDLPVTVTSSDPAVADVTGLVEVSAGERVATLTIVTGLPGEAILSLRVGAEVREFSLFVGAPPADGVPPVPAPIVGVEVSENP